MALVVLYYSLEESFKGPNSVINIWEKKTHFINDLQSSLLLVTPNSYSTDRAPDIVPTIYIIIKIQLHINTK